MSVSVLGTVLMATWFICTYFVTYKFTMLVCNAGKGGCYGFKIKWYHKAAGTYVLALPIFIFLAYLVTRLSLL